MFTYRGVQTSLPVDFKDEQADSELKRMIPEYRGLDPSSQQLIIKDYEDTLKLYMIHGVSYRDSKNNALQEMGYSINSGKFKNVNPPSLGQMQSMAPAATPPNDDVKNLMNLGYSQQRAEELSRHPNIREANFLMHQGLTPQRSLELMYQEPTKRAVEIIKQQKVEPNRAYELEGEERLAREEEEERRRHKKHGLKKIGHKIEKTIRKGTKAVIKALPAIAGIAGSTMLGGKPAAQEIDEEEGAPGGGGYQAPLLQQEQEAEQSLNPLMALMPSALDLFEKLHGKKDTEREKKRRESDERPEKMRQYKSGGFTGHINEGSESGIADNIAKKIPDKSYVWDATSVSLLGDGSSKNGIKKLKEFESHIDKSGVLRGNQHSGYKNLIDAKVSRDEYVMKPKTVAALGGGNFKKGAEMNDRARMNLRRQKGVAQKILPPNAKNVSHYFRGGY